MKVTKIFNKIMILPNEWLSIGRITYKSIRAEDLTLTQNGWCMGGEMKPRFASKRLTLGGGERTENSRSLDFDVNDV